jgi:SAM-dependent methyltransferase
MDYDYQKYKKYKNRNSTLDFYDENAEEFANSTQTINFNQVQKRFAEKLPSGGTVLDFGCGAGRDTKFFIENGFHVEATDGSQKLCEIASAFTGITVKQMLFCELDAVENYDGIWACSSILHLPKEELASVFQKMIRALKNEGIIYTSFKYGDFEGIRNGRYFTDFTEDSFSYLLKKMPSLRQEECWITKDVRPGKEEEKWLNLLLRKQTL